MVSTAKEKDRRDGEKLIVKNRRAFFDYAIEETYEGGLVLVGSEVKSMRDGKVDMVSAVVDADRHTVPVRVILDNADGRLKPNTYAKMQFQAATPPGSVEVAAGALVSDGARQYAYVKNAAGRFVKRDVVAGTVRDGRVVVFKGIAPGETVVSKGAILLDNQIDLAE